MFLVSACASTHARGIHRRQFACLNVSKPLCECLCWTRRSQTSICMYQCFNVSMSQNQCSVSACVARGCTFVYKCSECMRVCVDALSVSACVYKEALLYISAVSACVPAWMHRMDVMDECNEWVHINAVSARVNECSECARVNKCSESARVNECSAPHHGSTTS